MFKKLKPNKKEVFFLQTENSFLSSVKLSVKQRNEIMVMEMRGGHLLEIHLLEKK